MGFVVVSIDYYWGERNKVEEEWGWIEWQVLDFCFIEEEVLVVVGVYQGSCEWYLNEEFSYLYFFEWMSLWDGMIYYDG